MATDDRHTKSVTLIKDLRPGMKNVTCVFIVIDKGSVNHTKDGSVVRKCRVADKSASVCFSLWNEQASAIEGGDILKLTKGYSSLWKGSMVLYSGKYGHLEKIGEFNMVFSETPDMSEATQEPAQKGQQQATPPPPPNTSGGRNSDPRGTSGSGNGRMGTGPSGNWNGNNHLSNGHRETPPPPPPPAAGHMTHTPNHQGNGYYPPPQPKTTLSLEHSSQYRGPPQHHPNPPHERFHPYNQRPPITNHSPGPHSAWS